MTFLFNRNSHFNIANLVTFSNIISGILAIYFLTHGEFFGAALFAWLAGGFDIIDGKLARKYNLSTEFGVQLDSYADFLSFVIVPTMFIYFGVIDGKELTQLSTPIVLFAFVYYIISGLRRLIQFNINTDAGTVSHFVGVPTPMGAILLWVVFLGWHFEIITNEYIVLGFMIVVGYLLNSKIKIPHL